MPSRILLISTNRCTVPDPVFPLGLSYLNSALRQAGHDTRWLDYQADATPLAEVLGEFKPHLAAISLRNIDDVLIRKRETYYQDLRGLCDSIRHQAGCRIVMGGSGFSVFPERIFEISGADFGVQGEGEASLAELVAALENGSDYRSIPGLVFRLDGQLQVNPPRFSTPDVVLEPPDRPAGLNAHYLAASGMLNLQTQRGCAHACCYCTYPVIEGRTHRRRPPERVADDMVRLREAGARYVFIVDSIFNSSPEHVEETCAAIARRNSGLRWGCFLRPEGLTPDLMALMAKAGLAHIEFGSDSFCDEVLEAYAKRFTFADVFKSSELARAAGIDYCHFLICGGPGETEETLETSFTNSLRLPGAIVMAVVGMRIYPGTPLFSRALREGIVTPNTDLLEPVYFVAPGLTPEDIFNRLKSFSQRNPSWIAGDPAPEYDRLVQRLRSRGVAGPLWSYFAMLQRIMPAAASSAS